MHLDIKKAYLHIGIAQALPVAALGTAISHFYGGQTKAVTKVPLNIGKFLNASFDSI